MDMLYMALAETILESVRDRFGRIAAILLALLLVLLPIAFVCAAATYYLR